MKLCIVIKAKASRMVSQKLADNLKLLISFEFDLRQLID